MKRLGSIVLAVMVATFFSAPAFAFISRDRHSDPFGVFIAVGIFVACFIGAVDLMGRR